MVRLELTCDQLLFLRLIRLRRYISMLYKAEREGFEPPEVCPSTVFKTAAFDHSAISPNIL